jgi:hypothetical protein
MLTALLATAILAVPAFATPPEPPDPPGPVPAPELDVAPPRLGALWGSVSFWRPGDQGWSVAEANTPLAPGDMLATGADGAIEVQIGRGAFLRVRANSQLTLDDHRPETLVFQLDSGEASLELRALPDERIELRVPDAALIPRSSGLYRARVGPTTALIARRGGRALVTVRGAPGRTLGDGQQIVLASSAPAGPAAPPGGRADAPGGVLEQGAAAPEDEWDRWSTARTASLVDTASASHVSPGVSGTHDLDRHGRWTSTAEYGPVWIPHAVPDGWAPYSTGRWLWDPRFGWTWLDEASWGWVPYHYGRWVFVDGAWAWTPGPRVARVHYSPALVAFFGGAAIERPIGWVALGWGEPVVPWWGPPTFASRPWWGGWGGPRVVNNVVVHRTTVVNVTQVNVYRNTTVRNAVVVVPSDRFGRGHVGGHRVHHGADIARSPIRGRLPVEPVRVSARDGRPGGGPWDPRGPGYRRDRELDRRADLDGAGRPASVPGASRRGPDGGDVDRTPRRETAPADRMARDPERTREVAPPGRAPAERVVVPAAARPSRPDRGREVASRREAPTAPSRPSGQAPPREAERRAPGVARPTEEARRLAPPARAARPASRATERSQDRERVSGRPVR